MEEERLAHLPYSKKVPHQRWGLGQSQVRYYHLPCMYVNVTHHYIHRHTVQSIPDWYWRSDWCQQTLEVHPHRNKGTHVLSILDKPWFVLTCFHTSRPQGRGSNWTLCRKSHNYFIRKWLKLSNWSTTRRKKLYQLDVNSRNTVFHQSELHSLVTKSQDA